MKLIKPFATLLFLLLIFLIFSACGGGNKSDNQKDKYFRKILLDGSYKIIGRYQVTADEAANLNCYHLQYDSTGQPVMIEFLKNLQPNRDLIFGIHKMTFEYFPDYEMRRYFNIDGSPMTNFQGIFTSRLGLDDKGHYTGKDNYDYRQIPTADRNGVVRYEWQTDDKGRRVASVPFDKNGNVITDTVYNIYEIRWKYDDKGRRAEQSYHTKDGTIAADGSGLAIIRFEYYPSDEVSAQIYIGLDDDGNEIYKGENRAVWDKFGNSIENSKYGSDHQLSNRFVLDYDNRGNTVSQKKYGPKDSLQKIVNWEFDTLGTLTRTIVTDAEGNILSER